MGLFEEAYGLNINRLKSEFLDIDCESGWIDYLADKFESISIWQTNFLTFWQPIVDE